MLVTHYSGHRVSSEFQERKRATIAINFGKA